MGKILQTGSRVARALYDRDVYTWSQKQARALRGRRYRELDVEHLAEEIEDVGRREKAAVESYAARILEHFCKLIYWAWLRERNERVWLAEISAFRKALKRRLRDNPGLQREFDQILIDAWEDAKADLVRQAAHYALEDPRFEQLADEKRAADEYGEACPFTWEQLLDEKFPGPFKLIGH